MSDFAICSFNVYSATFIKRIIHGAEKNVKDVQVRTVFDLPMRGNDAVYRQQHEAIRSYTTTAGADLSIYDLFSHNSTENQAGFLRVVIHETILKS